MTRPTLIEESNLLSAWRWEQARADFLARLGREEQAAKAQELAAIYLGRLEVAGIGLGVDQ